MDAEALHRFIRGCLRRLRRERGLTLTEAARRAGLPVSSLSSLETGGHHFTLVALHRILVALNADIAEVWPPAWERGVEFSTGGLADLERVNWFRMREILVRAGGDSLGLALEQDERMTILGAIGLSDQDRRLLEQTPRCNLVSLNERGWTVLTRRAGKKRLHLCVKGGQMRPYLRELAQIYLSIWLAGTEM